MRLDAAYQRILYHSRDLMSVCQPLTSGSIRGAPSPSCRAVSLITALQLKTLKTFTTQTFSSTCSHTDMKITFFMAVALAAVTANACVLEGANCPGKKGQTTCVCNSDTKAASTRVARPPLESYVPTANLISLLGQVQWHRSGP